MGGNKRNRTSGFVLGAHSWVYFLTIYYCSLFVHYFAFSQMFHPHPCSTIPTEQPARAHVFGSGYLCFVYKNFLSTFCSFSQFLKLSEKVNTWTKLPGQLVIFHILVQGALKKYVDFRCPFFAGRIICIFLL